VNFFKRGSQAGLPDGIFSYQKSQFWALELENVRFYGYFGVVCGNFVYLWSFGIVCGNLV
jgi:hypothetical protein